MNEILEKIKKYSKPVDELLKVKISGPEEIKKTGIELTQQFEFELKRAGGNFFLSSSYQNIIHKIGEIIEKEKAGKIILGQMINDVFLNDLKKQFPNVTFKTLENVKVEELKKIISDSDIAISFADYLIAESGTLVMLSSRAEARMLSILTPINIVIADSSKILPNLQELLDFLSKEFGDKIPHSAVIFITGPSRTADIEKILIIGVHGPRELYVILK
jgi:L-lactate utilization protein LutC